MFNQKHHNSISKKIILILVTILLITTLSGCKSKPPEGISQEVWDDSLEVLDLIEVVYEEERVFRRKEEIRIYDEFLDFYESNRRLSDEEYEFVNLIMDLKTAWEFYLWWDKPEITDGSGQKQYEKFIESGKRIEEIIKSAE